MKTNGDMLHGGSLKEQHYEVMADYICKFVDEYKKEGIDIRGITSQNEPDEIQNWPSCVYAEKEEKKCCIFWQTGLQTITLNCFAGTVIEIICNQE